VLCVSGQRQRSAGRGTRSHRCSFPVCVFLFLLKLRSVLGLTAVRARATPGRRFPGSGGRLVPPPGCGEPSSGAGTVRCVLSVSEAKTSGAAAA